MSIDIPNGIIPNGTTLYRAVAHDHEGASVIIQSQGRFRPGVVVKVGPKRLTVAFGTSGTARREKAVARAYVYTTASGLADPAGVIAQHGAGVGSRGRAGGQYLADA